MISAQLCAYAKHEFKNISTSSQDLILLIQTILRICVAEAEVTKFQITQNLKSQKNRSKRSAYALHEQSIETHFTLRRYDESDVWLCDALEWLMRRLCHAYLCSYLCLQQRLSLSVCFESRLREILARHKREKELSSTWHKISICWALSWNCFEIFHLDVKRDLCQL